ncbi:hypothetical protein LWI28_009445 [Acer negundo]|uniref:Uncharacterized protein n=1 Tax=Acer negundo TaxID=4023 RepID=A0AAD5NSQ1_ACENE|nr:hypothetical protein LWI28_009445 [Acer negundo]
MESIEDDFSLGLRDDDGDDVAHYTTQQRTVTFSRAGSNSVTQKPRQKGPMDVYLTLDPEISVQKNKGKQKSNEWLIGRIDDHDDREDETVFSDDDGLTWNDVARAAEVGELSYWLPDCSSHPPPPPPSLRPPHLAPLCPPSMALLALSLHYPSLSLPHLHHHHGFGFLHRLLGCYLNSGPGPGSNLGPSLGLSLGLSPGLDSSIGLDQSQRRMTKRKS